MSDKQIIVRIDSKLKDVKIGDGLSLQDKLNGNLLTDLMASGAKVTRA